MSHADRSGFQMGEEQLTSVLTAAFPALEPSDALRNRIEALAGTRAAAGPRVLWRRAAWGLATCAAVAAAVAGVVFYPRLAAAQLLHRMENTLEDVQSAYMIRWTLAPDGSRTRDGEIWYQGGRWRLENARHIQVFRDGKLWVYEPASRKMTVERRSGPFAYNSSGASFGSMVRDYARWGWNREFHVERTVEADGRQATLVTIDEPERRERILLRVDARTDLPLRMEAQLRQGDGWETRVRGEFRFNEPQKEALFEPHFPEAVQIVDLNAERERVRGQLERGFQRQVVADRTIIIRDLYVNPEGDVFVLFSAGKKPGDHWNDMELAVRDSLGTRYVECQGAFNAHYRRPEGEWLVFDGERVESGLFAATTEQKPWRSRRLTLRVGVPEVNTHGGDPPAGGPLTFAEFRFPVMKPGPGLLPDYMSSLPGPLDENGLAKERAKARADQWRMPAFDQATGARGAALRRALAAKKRGDLTAALAGYREALRQSERMEQALRVRVSDVGVWLAVCRTLRGLGREQEATEALVRAQDGAREQKMQAPEWEKALREEGL